MIISTKDELKNYVTDHRIWQGIPSIEITKAGRIFVTFYSGNGGERLGNFAVVVMSDDDGKTFSEPVVAAYKDEQHRCFDPCLWIDPLERLWFTWSIMPDDGTYASICENPDADELVWSDSFYVGDDVMMNKPTVLSTGEWCFPIAIWPREMRSRYKHKYDPNKEPGAYIYRTVNHGETFERLGGADAGYRDFDEHMIVELEDGRLANYIRVDGGIAVCYSYDNGNSWSPPVHTGYGETPSRFHIRRLKSGRLLLVTHINSKHLKVKRTNLAALLSDDDGKTWQHTLMLDDRDWVSYPDAKEGDDGFIYIVYDRERQGTSIENAYTKAREILMAKISEDDIIAGKLVNSESKLRQIVSKLGKFYDESINYYEEPSRYTDEGLAELLLTKYSDRIIEKIFEFYAVNCVNMNKIDSCRLDTLIEALDAEKDDKTNAVIEIIKFVRSSASDKSESVPIIKAVKGIILSNIENDISVKEIAYEIGISSYYLMHSFKKVTGTTITNYKHSLKLSKAKRLLISSELNITEISGQCGFSNPSYFTEVFTKEEGISPLEYRKNLS